MNDITFIAISNRRNALLRTIQQFENQTNVDWKRINIIIATGCGGDFSTCLPHVVVEDREIAPQPTWPQIINHCVRMATTEFVSYWADDIFVDNNFLHNVLKEMEPANDIHVFPYIRHTAKTPFVVFADDFVIVNYGYIRKKSIIDAGMFDENYEFYNADGDMCIRIQQQSGTHKIYNNIVVWHRHRGGTPHLFGRITKGHDNKHFRSKFPNIKIKRILRLK